MSWPAPRSFSKNGPDSRRHAPAPEQTGFFARFPRGVFEIFSFFCKKRESSRSLDSRRLAGSFFNLSNSFDSQNSFGAPFFARSASHGGRAQGSRDSEPRAQAFSHRERRAAAATGNRVGIFNRERLAHGVDFETHRGALEILRAE